MYTTSRERYFEKDRNMVQLVQDNNWPCVALNNNETAFAQQCHKDWCEINCQRWTYNQEYYYIDSDEQSRIQHVDVFYFENDEDAVAFKLIWCIECD